MADVNESKYFYWEREWADIGAGGCTNSASAAKQVCTCAGFWTGFSRKCCFSGGDDTHSKRRWAEGLKTCILLYVAFVFLLVLCTGQRGGTFTNSPRQNEARLPYRFTGLFFKVSMICRRFCAEKRKWLVMQERYDNLPLSLCFKQSSMLTRAPENGQSLPTQTGLGKETHPYPRRFGLRSNPTLLKMKRVIPIIIVRT